LGINDLQYEDLAEFGIKRENLTAYIRELENTFLMWHGPESGEVPPSFVESLVDFEVGRFVPMETALNEPPPKARENEFPVSSN
jgi:hypothetical protein